MTPDRLEIPKGAVDLLVLRALSGGSRHGYEIMRRIETMSGGELIVEEGSLYPALHRMERRRLVESEWGTSEANRRAKFYTLTDAGRRHLKAETAAWRRTTQALARVLTPQPEGAP